MKNIAILGSTGSIGTSTLSIVESFPENFRIVALAAGTNIDLLREQIKRHQPSVVSVAKAKDALTLRDEFPKTRIVSGDEGLCLVACADEAHIVVAALVGSVGLVPTVAAIRAGKNIALANKETLVVAGELVMHEIEKAGVDLLPVDSEHNAIHQALRVGPPDRVRRIILTASGGPFRTWDQQQIAAATRADALNHPTWNMGSKITIDSATLMNKGLEIIEATHLFGMGEEQVDVVVHPQSLVHSLVEYIDGTQIAQLSTNDMRFPVLYALAWPDRFKTPIAPLDLIQAGQLSFEAPDPERFPALNLARHSIRAGGEMPAVLNAANEVCVEYFLQEQCSFPAIWMTVEKTLESWAGRNQKLETIEQAMNADRAARRIAAGFLKF